MLHSDLSHNFCRVKKFTVSYKSSSQLPKENELREMKIFVGRFINLDVASS